MSLLSFLVIVIGVLFAPQDSLDEGPQAAYVAHFLAHLEERHAPVFLAACHAPATGYTARLLLEVGSRKGLLIETRNTSVIGVADMQINSEGLVVSETEGGIYSYARMRQLARELAGYRFELLAPFRVHDMQASTPREICSHGEGKSLDPEIDMEIRQSVTPSVPSR